MNAYSIIEPIGEGSFGQVKRATCKASGDTVAIKILKGRYRTWKECSKLGEYRVFSDIHKTRNLKHPNLVTIRQVILQNQQLVIVFDYMPQNLHQMISGRKTPFSDSDAQTITKQILRGLEFMHRHGYFHRDLKPENVLCDGIHNVKIADLGQARRIRSKPPYTDYVATRWYRAPEVVLNSRNYNSPVDIWGAGAIMGELYTLHPLFKGNCQIDQLFLISCLIGTPKSGEWREGFLLANSITFSWTPHEPQNMRTVFPEASEESLTLLRSVLVWNPIKRPPAGFCLRILGEESQRRVAQPVGPGESNGKEVGASNLRYDPDSRQVNYTYVQGHSSLGGDSDSTYINGKRVLRRDPFNFDADSENSSYEEEVETYISTLKEKLHKHNSRKSVERMRKRQMQVEMAAQRGSPASLESAPRKDQLLLKRHNKINQAPTARTQAPEIPQDAAGNASQSSRDPQRSVTTTRAKRNKNTRRRHQGMCVRVPYPPFSSSSSSSSTVSSWGDTPPSSRDRTSRRGALHTQSRWSGTEELLLDDDTYVTPWNRPTKDNNGKRARAPDSGPRLLDDPAARDEELDDDEDNDDVEEDETMDSSGSEGLDDDIDDLLRDLDDQLNANPTTPPRARAAIKRATTSGRQSKQEENNSITAVFLKDPSFVQVCSRPRVKEKESNNLASWLDDNDDLFADLDDGRNAKPSASLARTAPEEIAHVNIDDAEVDGFLNELEFWNDSESDTTIENESADESKDYSFVKSDISRLLEDLAKERQARRVQK